MKHTGIAWGVGSIASHCEPGTGQPRMCGVGPGLHTGSLVCIPYARGELALHRLAVFGLATCIPYARGELATVSGTDDECVGVSHMRVGSW